tara:strand:+ start:470 stop:685 length:216 start_codon:yes stop_codon:yes gene_type:complete
MVELMAYTQTDIDRLKSAIGQGTLTVEVEGKRVTYRSVAEMREILNMMQDEVSGSAAAAKNRMSRVAFRRS